MFKDYLEKSRSPWYSFIFAFPALVIYELGLFWMRNIEFKYIQNSADFLIEKIINNSSFEVLHISSIIFFVVLIAILAYQKKKFRSVQVNIKYLNFMIVESLIYASILFFIMGNIYLMDVSSNDLLSNIILSFGAGIYEELIFRVLLIYLFAKLVKFLFRLGNSSSELYAIFFSAILFSLFHFIQIESFNLYSLIGFVSDNKDAFALRFIAGIFLGILYLKRGFGITAITHSIYDIFVIFLLT